MPIRTTASQVQEIIETDTTIALTAFISAGSMIVDRVVAVVKDSNGAAYHSSVELEMIERYLAAHFYAFSRDRRATMETVGSVQVNYQHVEDLRLDATEYGQMAKVLDTSGALAAFDNALDKATTIKAKAYWLGDENICK